MPGSTASTLRACYEANFAGAQPPLDIHAPVDPTARHPAGLDMQWAFVVERLSRDAFRSQYGVELAREALEAYVYPDHQMTPRQAQAVARLDAVWHRQAHEEVP